MRTHASKTKNPKIAKFIWKIRNVLKWMKNQFSGSLQFLVFLRYGHFGTQNWQFSMNFHHNSINEKLVKSEIWFFIRFSTVSIYHVNMVTSEVRARSAYPSLGQGLVDNSYQNIFCKLKKIITWVVKKGNIEVDWSLYMKRWGSSPHPFIR